MTIKILNQESELSSFPIKQSIFLYSDETIEPTVLKNNIILFRLQAENELINLAEPYSYTLGYIKETFDTVELTYKIESHNSGYKITCTPVKALHLDAKYCIYVSKDLSEQFISITKDVSKSTSNIEVVSTSTNSTSYSINVEVAATSSLINGKNLTKFLVNGKEYLLNLRESRSILFEDYRITFQDTIYVIGEKFTVSITNRTTLINDFQYVIKTVNSESITPIEVEGVSTAISNQDILNYYQQLNNNVVPVQSKLYTTYLSPNIFSIKLPEGFDLNLNSQIVWDLRVAYNNYILESLKLYDKDQKYILLIYKDDFENLLVFELIYSTDDSQTEKLVIDTSNL